MKLQELNKLQDLNKLNCRIDIKLQDARMAIFTRFSHFTLAATLLIGSFGICGNLVSVAIFSRREVRQL